MPPSSQKRYLLRIAQVGVRLVLDDGGFAFDDGFKQAAQWVGPDALLVDFPNDWRGGIGALAIVLEGLDFLGGVGPLRVDAFQSQGPLHRNLPVAESLVGEYLGLLCIFKIEKGVADAPDVLVGKLAVLVAKVPAPGACSTG